MNANQLHQYRQQTHNSPVFTRNRKCCKCGNHKANGKSVAISPVSRRKQFICQECM